MKKKLHTPEGVRDINLLSDMTDEDWNHENGIDPLLV